MLTNLNPAWYANPAYFVALRAILRKNPYGAQKDAAIAVMLSLTSWFAREWGYNQGTTEMIVKLGLAYYVWSLSLVFMFAAAWLLTADKKKADLGNSADAVSPG